MQNRCYKMTEEIKRLLLPILNYYNVNKIGAILEKDSDVKIVQILSDGELIELR